MKNKYIFSTLLLTSIFTSAQLHAAKQAVNRAGPTAVTADVDDARQAVNKEAQAVSAKVPAKQVVNRTQSTPAVLDTSSAKGDAKQAVNKTAQPKVDYCSIVCHETFDETNGPIGGGGGGQGNGGGSPISEKECQKELQVQVTQGLVHFCQSHRPGNYTYQCVANFGEVVIQSPLHSFYCEN